MERLTEKHYSGNGYYLKCSSDCPNDGFCDDCEKLFKAIDRLGEYEDKAEQKPKTNADRIRAMSDELLAAQLAEVFCKGFEASTGVAIPDEFVKEIMEQFLEQLKQPAEGD